MGDQANQPSQEHAVGINVYVSPQTQAFRCTYKHRYTDFLVNEISPDGNVLHLIDLPGDAQRKRKRDANDAQSSESKSAAPQKKQRPDARNAAVEAEAPSEKAKDVEQAKPELTSEAIKEIKAGAIASISETDRDELKSIFGEQTTSSILSLYASVVAYPDRKARDHNSVKSEPIEEKSKRTAAHICVRRILQSKLETLTVQDQDQQSGPGTIISIKAAPPKSAGPAERNGRDAVNGQRGKQDWADLGGEYVHFTLFKENKDTMEVLYFIASQLKLAIKNFSFAGTKDRRGVTVQRVAVHRMRRERLEGLSRLARGFRLGGPWEYKPDGLELGMLKGNEFLITLRDAQFAGEENGWTIEQRMKHAKETTAAATQELSEHGFLNYYGLQRFGTRSTGTHITGMRMLKGDLKGAINSILAYDPDILQQEVSNGDGSAEDGPITEQKKIPQEDIDRAKAIHTFTTTGSSHDAVALLGNRFQAEKGVMTYLGKRDRKTNTRPNENDFQGALIQIQRNLRLMYVHAYQSYVWNTVAGKRWELYGNKVVEGDLVVVGEKEQEEGVVTEPAKLEEVDEDGEPIFHPSASNGADGGDEQGGQPAGGLGEDPFVRGRPLSRAEAESGRFTVFDVILPLPGFDVEYPNNEIGQLYKDFMASESGGGLDPHSMRRAWKDISLPGGYRKMMARPLDKKVEVDVRAYTKVDEQMVETDLEKLLKSGANKKPDGAPTTKTKETNGGEAQVETGDEPPKIAVVLKLQLRSSQYATMALRELTKGGATAYQPEFSMHKR